jgi:hypothetical protein
VALKYTEGKMGAPKVVAKGADEVAAKIRELAREHKVPLLEAPPLARALHTHTEIGDEIPKRCTRPWPKCWPTCSSCAPLASSATVRWNRPSCRAQGPRPGHRPKKHAVPRIETGSNDGNQTQYHENPAWVPIKSGRAWRRRS